MTEMNRTLGATGISTTAIALGLAALGRPGYLNLGHGGDFDEHSVHGDGGRGPTRCSTPRTRRGVRHFDAARSYGRAEEFLGQWLRARSIEPGAVTISSKWGYTYTADWQVDADPPEVKDLSADTLRRQLAETREQLGEHLTLYQIHSATAVERRARGPRRARELLPSCARAESRSGSAPRGPSRPDTIRRAIEVGGFDTVQATLQPARALGRRRAGGRPRRGDGRDHQGGAGQRPADGPRRRSSR